MFRRDPHEGRLSFCVDEVSVVPKILIKKITKILFLILSCMFAVLKFLLIVLHFLNYCVFLFLR